MDGKRASDKLGRTGEQLEKEAIKFKEAYEALKGGETAFATLFQEVPVAMLLLDRERRIREINRRAKEHFTRANLEKKDLGFGNAIHCVHSLDDPDGCGFGPSCETCSMRRIIADTFQTGKRHKEVEIKLTLNDGRQRYDKHLLVSTEHLKLPQGHNVLVCFQDITEQKQAEVKLRHAFSEIEQLKEQLKAESIYLQDEIKLEYNFEGIIGQSNALNYVFLKIDQIASTDSTVLILGETGTGKELVARAIHSASPRNNRPLVKVNCAVLPRDLIENELFGHEKGAFTDAHNRQIGRFEVANGSTLFLDEIGELPLDLQAKLLRVLQDGEFERLGSSHTIKTDVRIIVATNRNPDEEIRKGRFRKDLYYRLNVFPITVPPLRKRTEDIPLLVDEFVKRSGKKLGKQIKTISNGVMKALQNYPWPGNIRELENMIERAVINTRGSKLQLADKIDTSRDEKMPAARRGTLSQVERDYILQVLEETNWKVSGKNGAAEILGINPNTLRGRMRKLGIQRT